MVVHSFLHHSDFCVHAKGRCARRVNKKEREKEREEKSKERKYIKERNEKRRERKRERKNKGEEWTRPKGTRLLFFLSLLLSFFLPEREATRGARQKKRFRAMVTISCHDWGVIFKNQSVPNLCWVYTILLELLKSLRLILRRFKTF